MGELPTIALSTSTYSFNMVMLFQMAFDPSLLHYENIPMQYLAFFHAVKTKIFR